VFKLLWISVSVSILSFVGGNLAAQYWLYGTFVPHMKIGLVQKTELTNPQIYCYYDKNNHLIVPERSTGNKKIHMNRYEDYACQTDNERQLFKQIKNQNTSKENVVLVENIAYQGKCLDIHKDQALKSNFLVDCNSLLQADKY
jgi:hypothetical protein